MFLSYAAGFGLQCLVGEKDPLHTLIIQEPRRLWLESHETLKLIKTKRSCNCIISGGSVLSAVLWFYLLQAEPRTSTGSICSWARSRWCGTWHEMPFACLRCSSTQETFMDQCFQIKLSRQVSKCTFTGGVERARTCVHCYFLWFGLSCA